MTEKQKEKDVNIKETDGQNEDQAFEQPDLDDVEEGSNELKAHKGQKPELPVISGDFEVIKLIGQGGMGAVYEVRDLKLDKIVAIKILQSDLAGDKAALKRFEQEAEAASNLSHPNLGSTYGHGTTETGAPYIVLDYYEGKSLAEVLKEEGVLNSKRVLNIMRQICEGLCHAHEKGVVHRDIKPTNIIVSPTEDGGEIARIVDFGIAKVMPQENRETHNLTETGEVFGSPNYMSPEQCLGFMLDNRSDIYSLGCLMFEMLSGDPPFAGSNPIQVVVKHINEDVNSLPQDVRKNKEIDKLERVMLKCLEKDQTNRYQSAEELLNDIKLIADGKAPLKHKRAVKQKREFTKRQLVAIVVGIAALVFYGVVSAAFFQQMDFLFIMLFGILNTLVIGGLYVSFSTFNDHRHKLEKLKNTGTSWWMMILTGFFSIVCMTVLPYSLVFGTLMFFREHPAIKNIVWPEWFAQLSYCDIYVHLLAVLGVIVAGFGLAIFRGKKRIGFGKVSIQFIGLTTALVILSTTVFPKQVSKVCYSLATMTGLYMPAATKTLSDIAYTMNKEALDNARLLAEFNIKTGNYKEALNIIDNTNAFKDYQFDAVRLKLLAYEKQGDLEQAQKIATEALSNPGINRDQVLCFRAAIYEKMGNFIAALNDYKAANEASKSSRALVGQARMQCALGNHKEALEILDVDPGNRPADYEILLKAFIKQKLGDAAGAQNLFDKLGGRVHDSISPWSGIYFQGPKEAQKWNELYSAYANNQIDKADKVKEHLGKAHPFGKSDLKNSGLLGGTNIVPPWKSNK